MSKNLPRPVFYRVALVLMLLAVSGAIVQKASESKIAVTMSRAFAAGTTNTPEVAAEAQSILESARLYFAIAGSLVAAALGCWILAVRHGEQQRIASMALTVLLCLYIMLEMLIV